MDSKALDEFFLDHWHAVIEKCQLSLEPHDLDDIATLNSWEVIQSSLLDPSYPELALVKPAISHLNTFVDLFETKLGPSVDPAFFWGALGVLLQVSSQSPATTRTIQRVLKSIGYKADSFNNCCAAVPAMVTQMKEACFDIQIQLLEFFIDAILCLRGEFNDPRLGGSKTGEDPLQLLEKRFLGTSAEVNETLTRVEKLTQFGLPTAFSTKLSIGLDHTTERERPCLRLPETKTPSGRFFNRVDLFEKLDQALGNDKSRTAFKSVALWGLGGIGKSSVAMRYVEIKVQQKDYDAIFWVHGEKMASLRQSFTEIAMKLKLPNASLQSHDENLQLLQEWFQTTDQTWLMIYDNVSSKDVLGRFWPSSSHGHAIITTRNPSLAFDYASSSVEVTSWDPKTGSDFLFFLLKKDIGKDLEKEGLSALELSKRLSGHALGLSHMAGLIHRKSWSITEFMSNYLKNPRRAHDSELETLLAFSFESLDAESRSLLAVLAFLMPENVPQHLFEIDEDELPDHLKFCSDGFNFSDRVESLLMLSLVKRNRDTRVFSIHRVIQTHLRYFLKAEELQKSFNDAVSLVYRVFPKQDDEKGQLYEQWARCNAYLQHIIYMADCFQECRKTNKSFKATSQFCDLLIECQRYLFEANLLDELRAMCDVNLEAVKTLDATDHVIDIRASTLSHLAQMQETLGNAELAITLNREGLELRLHEKPRNLALISGFENNLGCAYGTANDHQSALLCLKNSQATWNKAAEQEGKEPTGDPIIMANIGRSLFYHQRPDDAREHVNLAIVEFRKEKPVNWGGLAYATFILGMIARHEGEVEAAEAHFFDAQNVWLQGDHTRLHPFNGACMFKIGACCLDQGKTEAAVKHLRDSIEVTRCHKGGMPMEHGRNLFKLSEALTQDDPESMERPGELLREAENLLKKGRLGLSFPGTEELFSSQINIAWR